MEETRCKDWRATVAAENNAWLIFSKETDPRLNNHLASCKCMESNSANNTMNLEVNSSPKPPVKNSPGTSLSLIEHQRAQSNLLEVLTTPP